MFLALLFALAPAYAQTAQQLATAVDHHYNALKRMRVDFTETYSGMGMDRRETGVLLLEKPGRMRWDYALPAGKVFVLDGKYGWFYTPGDAQVQQIPASKLDDLRSPLRFLLGHTELEKELTHLSVAPAAVTVSSSERTRCSMPRGTPRRRKRPLSAGVMLRPLSSLASCAWPSRKRSGERRSSSFFAGICCTCASPGV